MEVYHHLWLIVKSMLAHSYSEKQGTWTQNCRYNNIIYSNHISKMTVIGLGLILVFTPVSSFSSISMYNWQVRLQWKVRSSQQHDTTASIMHTSISTIDEFQINEINVDLRTSGFDNEVLSVDACAVWWERESFYCLPRISVVTWHREPRFQCGSARTCSIWNSSIREH